MPSTFIYRHLLSFVILYRMAEDDEYRFQRCDADSFVPFSYEIIVEPDDCYPADYLLIRNGFKTEIDLKKRYTWDNEQFLRLINHIEERRPCRFSYHVVTHWPYQEEYQYLYQDGKLTYT